LRSESSNKALQQVEQTLHHAVVLELGLETRPDLIEFPAGLPIRRANDIAAPSVLTGQPKLITLDSLEPAVLIPDDPGRRQGSMT
jgi:hypothetical protein